MPHTMLRCSECQNYHLPDMKTLGCERCGAPLDVEYIGDGGEQSGIRPPGWTGPAIPLPVHTSDAFVTLGEGGTPCVSLNSISKELGLENLVAKLEFMNPTGSFKDRGTSIMMSVAREQGVREIVEDSSGNAGASVSAYAARAGIRAHIFAPSTAPEAKLQQIKVYGAQTHAIEGSREDTTRAAVDYCAERGLVYASHNLSPYFIEGTKMFAYELFQQYGQGIPGDIVMPVGNGSLFIGAWKGFQELRQAGLLTSMPRLHAVQASAVMPLAAAYDGVKWKREPGSSTIAGGISVGDPPRLRQCLRVLQESGGVALAVDDDAIKLWHGRLAEVEGIYAEPTSAAAFAGLERLAAEGRIDRDGSVLVAVTGFGLKDAPPA